MGKGEDYPELRELEAFPAELSGQKVIALRDPLNLSGKVLFFPYPAYFIVSMFDGRHSTLDIQRAFMGQFGQLLHREQVLNLISQLGEHFLLDDERSQRLVGEIVEKFKHEPTRKMGLAGECFPPEPARALEAIEGFFREPGGPGWPAAKEGQSPLVGAIAPHIDYRRGGACYAWAHRAILESCPADLFIILGTAHSPTNQPFALTRKDFETPWGSVETDRGFLQQLESQLATDFYEDEFVHKGEHSIELQLVFLDAVRGRRGPLRVIPVLCGSFHEAIRRRISPLELPGVAPFLAALKETLAPYGRRACLLASADLAHVGKRFGDPEEPNRFTLQELADEDRRLLAYAERIDGEGFFQTLARDQDRRRICGLPSVYALLHLIEAREGRLLHYGQSPDPGTASAVTFASMAFYG